MEFELSYRKTNRAVALRNKIHSKTSVLPNEDAYSEEVGIARAGGDASTPVPSSEARTQIPQRVDLGPKPPVENMPTDILSAWTALEVLAPQSYKKEVDLVAGKKALIARFDKTDLPWQQGEKSRPKKRLYYELILGTVALEPIIDELLKLYSDDRPEKAEMKGFCPIASIILDKTGRPIDDVSTIAVSSFAWGAPVALKGDLTLLAGWSTREKELKDGLFSRLKVRDSDDEIVPLTKSQITKVFHTLVKSLSLESQFVRAPHFAIRRYEYFQTKAPPEPGLLNSFFLEDLSTARALSNKNELPNALQHYLGVLKPREKTDLLESEEGLRTLLQPALTPLGRWPGKGRHPLALLQQAAVNATDSQLMHTGILAVNGPPGTGKTTLLRDVVAARVIDRAKVMSEFDKPQSAFKATEQTLQRNSEKIVLHSIDKRLKGFEMIVASSNNKAVENLSVELPGINAIAEDAPGLRYFKSVADNVLDSENWGTIAAVLGKSSNRFHFSQKFWRDEEHGMSTYLNHACGIPQFVSEIQEDAPPLKRNRSVVDAENPPSDLREALVRWKNARSEFKKALSSAADTQNTLQTLHEALVRAGALAKDLERLPLEQERACARLNELKSSAVLAEEKHERAVEQNRVSDEKTKSVFSQRPGVFSRLFKTARYRGWQTEYNQASAQASGDSQIVAVGSSELDQLKVDIGRIAQMLEGLRVEIFALSAESLALSADIARIKHGFNTPIPDSELFALAHEDRQVANIWFDDADNRARDRVFEAAIALHRAFIDGAADPLRQNLSVFIGSFGTHSLGSSKRDEIIADLWTSFFLIVPVVSSTFASVNRMFSRLAPESLGWLLVDEAGQAVPQAAVGAMIRTKHSVVVGDPLQIEPVVTLPSTLTREICGYFGVDHLKYNAPTASVQTVADAASIFGSQLRIGSGYRSVGAPLLVHRRCDSPMFEISNEIAYDNLMVQAKKPTNLSASLGRSRWIDVTGESGPDKWCADEGQALIELIQELRGSGATPDFYVVTPFVVVQNQLRKVLQQSRVLEGWVEEPSQWVWSNVGTVHTVQGREAPIVFFVLGAQHASQKGARGWAGRSPNLLNVAVTRAKASLYVIGNRNLWKDAGVFSVLDRYLA